MKWPRWVTRAVAYAGLAPRDEGVVNFFQGYGGTSAGVEVNENTAHNCSAIWAAVNIISSSMAIMPIRQYRRVGGLRQRVDQGPLVDLLDLQPNPEMSIADFKQTLQNHALIWGNGYAEIERKKSGLSLALWPITPDRCEPVWKNGRLMYKVIKYPDYTETFLPAEDVLHVHGMGFDGVRGYNVVHMARQSFGLTIAEELYGATLFGNGARPSGVLQTDQRLKPEAIKNLRQSWNEEQGGSGNWNRVAILHDGLKWQQMSLANDEAQFLESRKFQIEEIARWFNLPPHMIRHLERATFSNIEQQGEDYVRYTLMPWMVRWEQELRRKLLGDDQRSTTYFKYDADELARGDMLTRYKAWSLGRQWGWLSADDIREKEDMDPLPEEQGRFYLVPRNMEATEQLEEEIENGTGDPAAAGTGDPAGAEG